jgi:hypothetical protein
MHRSNSSRRLRFETLENRTLLAGNVTASVASGVLTITGDTGANNIQLAQTSAGTWRLSGTGTQINGARAAQSFSGVTDISMELAGGNDIVRCFGGTLSGDLSISNSALGNTTINLTGISAANISLSTSDGADSISLNRVQASGSILVHTFATDADAGDNVNLNTVSTGTFASINTGGGNDTVTVNRYSGNGFLTVQTFTATASGNDSVGIINSSTSQFVNVYTGNGNDRISISRLSADSLQMITFHDGNDGDDTIVINRLTLAADGEIETGAGNDSVTVAFCTCGRWSVFTGDGNDTVSIWTLSATDQVSVSTGDGTDKVTLSSVSAVNQITADVGSGNSDTLTVVRSTTAAADFEAGGDSGDTLVRIACQFTSQTIVGFVTVI